MRKAFLLHVAVHLKFLARNRVFHGFLLLIALGVLTGIVPTFFFFDRTTRFVVLRGLAEQLHAAAGLITAGIALFVLWSHRRARSIKMIATTPAPFDAWVASVFGTAALVGLVVQALIAVAVMALSFYWNVPYQLGFLYVAINRFAGSLIMLGFVTALGAWLHPIIAVLLLALVRESIFWTLRVMLDSADARPIVSAAKAVATAIYYALPTFDPYAGRTLLFTRSMRVPVTDWRYLAITLGYALLALAFGYVTTIVMLRRKPLT